jgi:hypothetical protein
VGLPGPVVHVEPQDGTALVANCSANPLKLFGAPAPLLSGFSCDHWAPRNVTVLLMAAIRSPITNETLLLPGKA